MKLILFIAALLLAALGYGSRPVTTEEFLALDQSIRSRLLAGAVNAAVEPGQASGSLRANEQTVLLARCVERAAARPDGAAIYASATIDSCARKLRL